MKRWMFPLWVVLALGLSACGTNLAETPAPTPTETVVETPAVNSYTALLQQFFLDAPVPEAAQEQFSLAMQGDFKAQEWVDEYRQQHDDLSWQVADMVCEYGSKNGADICLFNIAMLYYRGNDSISFTANRAAAFAWAELAADKGSVSAALCAGDMSRSGNGVPVDEQAAFAFYNRAHVLGATGKTAERLGDCYAEGIGTAVDRDAAFAYYMDSAAEGYSSSLYKLLDFSDYIDIDEVGLHKAVSSAHYSGGYWAIAYGGLEGYSADELKESLVNRLLVEWEGGADPAAANLRRSVRTNPYFPADFVEAMTQTVYTYSYHAFAEEYGLYPNRTQGDMRDFALAPYDTSEPEYGYYEGATKRYLEWEEAAVYAYDFDGDGAEEIGIPIHSGAGGAFMGDGFAIFKQNKEGLYEYWSGGPNCSLRDGMRIIQFGGRVYFIVNPFDDTGHAPHDVLVYTIDEKGYGHEMTIQCREYSLQPIVTCREEPYASRYEPLFSAVEQQVEAAVSAVKQLEIYCSEGEERFEGGENRSLNTDFVDARRDFFVTADLFNDGKEMVIYKGRLILQMKYYFDFNWFQIYEASELDPNAMPFDEVEFLGEHFGQHSSGNLYDHLPVDSVVQFWTQEYNGTTFCVTLGRYGLRYVLQVFEIKDGETSLVSRSMYFDTAQQVEVAFQGAGGAEG